MFAAAAALAGISHVGPLTYATWAPLAFELADLVLVLALFRMLAVDRRVPWLAALLYVGLISWVGQDYFSPQAFGYLLWLGIALIILRWLRSVPPTDDRGRLRRYRAPLLVGLPTPPPSTRRMRTVAVVMVAAIYFAVVAAHQLTPYVALTGVGAFAILDLLRPRWLPLLLGVIAVGFLIPRYGLIAHDFGGLFSGGNPLTNAAGRSGTYHAGPEQLTAWIVRGLAACMWLGTLAAISRQRRTLGRVVIAAVFAFSPFVMLGVQNYGGEAIYRIYLFSSPWCALLIAEALIGSGVSWRRWLIVAGASFGVLAAGLQGLYGPVHLRAFTPAELTASQWLFSQTPQHSLIALPDDDFPAPEGALYNAYDLQYIPADPQLGAAWVNEGDVGAVERWVASLGRATGYVVFSRSMGAYAEYFGAPRGYSRLARTVATSPGWSIVYQNADVKIYHVDLTLAADGNPSAVRAVNAPRRHRRGGQPHHARAHISSQTR